MTLNRVVAVASVVVSLALAVLPVLADMDWSSTAGIVAGILALLAVTDRWLKGWQQFENRAAVTDPARDLPRPVERPE